MKKLFQIISVLVFVAFALVSCGGGADNKNDDGDVIKLYAIDNLSEYVVVRSENSSETETKLATSLRKAINDATDANIGVKTDYNNNKFEILVGNTKRQQSIDAAEGLRYGDYTIKKVGNKVVIVGGSDDALTEAVELFKTSFIDPNRKVVKLPLGDGYSYKAEILFDKLTVEGVDISEFSVFNNTKLNVSEFAAKLSNALGYSMAQQNGNMVDGKNYIVLEATELIADKYSVTVEDGNIVVRGSAHSISAAIDYFGGDFLKNLGSKTYDITSSDNFEGSTGKKETYTKDQLMAVIEKVYADPNAIIVGEQVCGNPKGADNIAESIALFETATGQTPGIIGIDLACYGLGLPEMEDDTWSAYICDLVDYVAGGGIVTASAHWANPSGNLGDTYDTCRGVLGYDNSREAYEKAFTDLLTKGTEYNDAFMSELEDEARFLKALKDNGVSIIWRPLHEANGNWFWFCHGGYGFDTKYIVDIWHYVYDYFTEEWGLDNLIWCFAPNVSTAESVMSLYPGDEYCDMVGVDWYTSGNLEIANDNNYLHLTDLSRKPGAITEFGTSAALTAEDPADQIDMYNAMTFYDELYDLVEDGYSFAYVITWYNRYGITYLGLGDELMEQEMTLNQSEVKAIFDSIK